MEITGKVHCIFEQSGTFKKEFHKMGIQAEDYDIQNSYGETDHIVDLFKEIENAFEGKPSIFDQFSKDDLIMAFFPCIFFCEANTRLFRFEDSIHRIHTHRRAIEDMLVRSKNRQRFFEIAMKMFSVCDDRGLRLIVENPYSPVHFLVQYFPYRASVIDKDRTRRGDNFKKPTQYWFVNCEPTEGYTEQVRTKKSMNHIDDRHRNKKFYENRENGFFFCSDKKSQMTPDYARNFICDFILGKKQDNIDLQLF